MRYSLSDYSVTARSKGWGPGWPTDRWTDMARVQAARSGVAVNVHRRIARLVLLLLNETERRGYLCRGGQTGAYNNRPIGGTRTASNHSWGLAIDINWSINFASYDGRNHGDLPSWVPPLWARYGFAWGGNYSGKFKDPMHFEFMGSPADADDMTALALDELRNAAATTPQEDNDMPTVKELNDAAKRGELADLVDAIANRTTTKVRDLAGLAKADQIVNVLTQLTARIDSGSTRLGAAITDSRSAILGAVAAMPTDDLSEAERQQLAADIAAQVDDLSADDILDALAERLADPTPEA